MEKLAKALEKARSERGSHYAPPSQAGIAAPALIPAVNAVQVNDSVLERNRIIAHHSKRIEADRFRILRTQVLQAMAQSGMRTLGITSPNYGDGKTTIALNLALSIALDLKQTVLLVDIDLRKPNVMEYMGLVADRGLTDYFASDVPIADCLVRPSFDRLALLPAGKPLERSSEMLGSPKIAALAMEMKSRYADRLIIYDMPPVLAQDDPLVFLPHVDGVLLVVNEGITRTSELKASMNALSGAHVIGTVLNNSHDRPNTGMLGRLLDGKALKG